MIVWLASYPRSGNTLLRLIIRQVFGPVTYSIYDDRKDIAADPALSALIGHQMHGRTIDEFVAAAHTASDRYLVKTHELPADDSPAIYVIRDGRAATASFWHFLREVNAEPATLEQVARGDVFCGCWGDHVSAWRPTQRPRTLLVRYEQLVAADPGTIAAIGAFLGLDPVGPLVARFEDLHRMNPKFFRTGSDATNIAELEARCAEIFWLRNGPSMAAFGYGADPFAALPIDRRRQRCDALACALATGGLKAP